MLSQNDYAAAFAQHIQLGPAHLKALHQITKGDWERLFRAPPSLPPALKPFVQEVRRTVDPLTIQKKLQHHGITVLTPDDQDFPPLLGEIPDPPFVLFVQGNRALLSDINLVAIVGTRKITDYGKHVVETFAPALVKAGCVTVSGLALGIDGSVHRETLSAGGQTIAMLPCGPDMVYPSSHRGLARQIIDNGGALVSEFPLGTPALKQNFVIRNRLIAGLCRATIIIEATEHSGTFLTARAALESNREVFAVPGSIFAPTSAGPHALLKQGAQLLDDPDEVLAAMGIATQNKATVYTPTADEQPIIQAIPQGAPIEREALARALKMEPTNLNALLTMLELKGVVRINGNRIERLVSLSVDNLSA